MTTIGVLALQGDFLEHIQILESLKQKTLEVRSKEDLKECKALIIPGGESTTIGKLLKETGLDSEIKKQVPRKRKIGFILLATAIEYLFIVGVLYIFYGKCKRGFNRKGYCHADTYCFQGTYTSQVGQDKHWRIN